MKSLMRLLPKLGVFVASWLVWSPGTTRAQTTINIFTERQEEKKKARWTLADWLKTKQTMAEQNFWLARHTNKVPVDLAFSPEISKTAFATDFDLYVAWLGLKLRYERPLDLVRDADPNKNAGNEGGQVGMQFRAFGGNLQNTNLILRFVYEYDHVRGFVAGLQGPYAGWSLGGELQIYFAQWLGVRGEYLYRLTRENTSDRSVTLGGSGWSAVAFLELSLFRLEGGWEGRTWDFASSSDASLTGARSESGLVGRMRLFF